MQKTVVNIRTTPKSNVEGQTNGRTDKRNDGPTNTMGYRITGTQLEKKNKNGYGKNGKRGNKW